MKRYAAIATFLLLTLPAVGQKKQKKNADNVPPPVAQSGPSFEVTKGWLISTLTDYSGSFDFEDRYSNFQISNSCILTFHLGHIPTGDKKEFKDLSGEITGHSRRLRECLTRLTINALTLKLETRLQSSTAFPSRPLRHMTSTASTFSTPLRTNRDNPLPLAMQK